MAIVATVRVKTHLNKNIPALIVTDKMIDQGKKFSIIKSSKKGVPKLEHPSLFLKIKIKIKS